MLQAPNSFNCHYNSVQLRTQNQPFMPWKHLNSKNYASYIYKWYKLVKINKGDPNELGNWGVQFTVLDSMYSELSLEVLEIQSDYVIVQGVEQIGPNQAIQSTTVPVIVWSRFLRPEKALEFPRLIQWTHEYEDCHVMLGKYLKIEPTSIGQDQNWSIVQGAFGVELENTNFHQILDPRDFAQFLYKWGELVNFGTGEISEIGNWGLKNENFNFQHEFFVVLCWRATFVLVKKALVYQDNAIAEDPNSEPFWAWSRLLRLYTKLVFPRSMDGNWNHPWEPTRPIAPPAGYYQFKGPQK